MNKYQIKIAFKSDGDEEFEIEFQGSLEEVSNEIFKRITSDYFMTFMTLENQAIILQAEDISRLVIEEVSQ